LGFENFGSLPGELFNTVSNLKIFVLFAGTRCWMLDTGYWMLDTGCWMFDTGFSILDTGCWEAPGIGFKV
jgi:hypothetical protein